MTSLKRSSQINASQKTFQQEITMKNGFIIVKWWKENDKKNIQGEVVENVQSKFYFYYFLFWFWFYTVSGIGFDFIKN